MTYKLLGTGIPENCLVGQFSVRGLWGAEGGSLSCIPGFIDELWPRVGCRLRMGWHPKRPRLGIESTGMWGNILPVTLGCD